MNEREIDKELRIITGDSIILSRVLEFLLNDAEVNALLNKCNDNMIGRMGYTDHGRVHSKIVALNALRLLSLLKIKPTIIAERDGLFEDSRIAVLISAWLHDTGCSITRDNHELLGVVIAQPLITNVLERIYDSEAKIVKMMTYIEQGILCHMGNYKATSVEASIVCVADGTDITKGRARLSYMMGDRDIHDFSAMSIQKVEIKKGVKIHVYMNSPAGIFQVEETLLKKLKSTNLKDYIKIVAHIKGDKNIIEY